MRRPLCGAGAVTRGNPAGSLQVSRKGDAKPMDKKDMQRVETYLRRTFGNASIRVLPRARKTDSAEVYIGEESIGVISEDNEDGETSYDFHMAILDIDLEMKALTLS